ncbi:MAG TPA: protein kinase [Polyangiaceae bacterium]|nr:protein kinase [Polyangiaceae bacterium]
MTAQREFSDGELVPGTRYRVVALIGSGGMGSVYEVEHVELGKRFVLKALLRSLTNRDDLVHRLRNEWRALGKLEHRNIVGVTDAGITTTGMPYFVMERLQGETLAGRLRRDRRIPVRDALIIAADVLAGLSAAHRIGIVHRDVKPPNVFLVTNKPAKLLDFGIAKVLDPKASQITGRGIAIGTPRYMAPEQATGEAVDARTDLYAVGLILFEMIAGEGPFDRTRDPNELFLAHIATTAPPLTSIAPFAPPALDPWLARLLAKKPSHRPDDAEAVAVALRALATELVAPSVRPGERDKDDPTLAGGPFDTLEAAQTIPSDGSARLDGVPTRTGVGPGPLSRSKAPPAVSRFEPQSGQTVRLEALTSSEDVPTRTRVPTPLPDTPLPVAETPPLPEPQSSRRWARTGVVLASLAAIGGGAVLSMRFAGVASGAASDATTHAAVGAARVATPVAAPPPPEPPRPPQNPEPRNDAPRIAPPVVLNTPIPVSAPPSGANNGSVAPAASHSAPRPGVRSAAKTRAAPPRSASSSDSTLPGSGL